MNRFTTATRIGLMVLLMALFAPLLHAQEYGVATIEQGQMVVIRDGQRLVFTSADGQVPINQSDLLRVGPNSQVLLETIEKATLTLGSNAVLHVEPWEQQEEQGFLRMLFGRVRATIDGLVGGETFNVQTATATIGVKGTEYTAGVNARGDTMILVTESVVQLTGVDGITQNVGVGQVSVALFGRGASSPRAASQNLLNALDEEGLDSPEVDSEDANDLPAQDELIEEGVVDEADLATTSDSNETADGTPQEDTQGDSEVTESTATDPTVIAIDVPTINLMETIKQTISVGVTFEN